ncbi:MAG: pantoate--beta-alanine ligase [Frankia sp.]|nr:pantoate--beta-alanine ligase [Frankia sp.]
MTSVADEVLAPVLVRTVDELDQALDALRAAGHTIALVPTMGALHDGHAELMREASRHGAVIVSIFVNPLQFAPGEDYERYPRTLDADLEVCRREGVSVVWAPSVDDVYAGPGVVRVSAGPRGDVLEGASRPGHFDGVLTVVAKLFHLVAPDVALFGQKDWQQAQLIGQMVRDLNFARPKTVATVATVRAADGLALSSRNAYLSPAESAQATVVPRALEAGQQTGLGGGDAAAILAAARRVLADEPGVRVDYLALVDPETFEDVAAGPDGHGPAVLLVAAYVGKTRLIDNTHTNVGGPPVGAARTHKEP